MMAYRHVSAMPQEVMTCLACRPGGVYADCTLGGAGHARAICESIVPDGLLIGIDQDADAIANARRTLTAYAANVRFFHGNFIHLPDYMHELQIDALDGILMDLGLSQHHLEASGRGFTFQKDEPLDMRMDTRAKTTAEELLNGLTEAQLSDIFYKFGEERYSRRIARSIVNHRRTHPIRTTAQLVALVGQAVPARAKEQKIHPATRVFMALRIAVNEELEVLGRLLSMAVDLLKIGGRICVLSFHSLEDRMVKQHFSRLARTCTCPPELPQCICSGKARIRPVTKKVQRPSEQEAALNPMARSTRLRCAERLT